MSLPQEREDSFLRPWNRPHEALVGELNVVVCCQLAAALVVRGECSDPEICGGWEVNR